MRRILPLVIAGAALVFPSVADAKITTSVKIETYRVSGQTGAALVKAMDRNGPRHGFMARAIAQTRYTVAWGLGWSVRGDRCRLASTAIDLDINYRYPALAPGAPAEIVRRWARFMAGVKRHEEMHGQIARQMAAAAEKSVARVAFDADPSCRRAKAEVARRVKAIYAQYEARQQAFDAREHAAGGKVDRLVSSLIGLD